MVLHQEDSCNRIDLPVLSVIFHLGVQKLIRFFYKVPTFRGDKVAINTIRPFPKSSSIPTKSQSQSRNTRLHIILSTNAQIHSDTLFDLGRFLHIHIGPIPHLHGMFNISTIITRLGMDTHGLRPIRSLVPASPLRTATPSLRSQFFTHIQHSFTNYFQLAFSEFSDPFSIFAINLSIYHSLWRVYTEKYRNSGQKCP